MKPRKNSEIGQIRASPDFVKGTYSMFRELACRQGLFERESATHVTLLLALRAGLDGAEFGLL